MDGGWEQGFYFEEITLSFLVYCYILKPMKKRMEKFMTDKEVQKLKRVELLELLVEQVFFNWSSGVYKKFQENDTLGKCEKGDIGKLFGIIPRLADEMGKESTTPR